MSDVTRVGVRVGSRYVEQVAHPQTVLADLLVTASAQLPTLALVTSGAVTIEGPPGSLGSPLENSAARPTSAATVVHLVARLPPVDSADPAEALGWAWQEDKSGEALRCEIEATSESLRQLGWLYLCAASVLTIGWLVGLLGATSPG